MTDWSKCPAVESVPGKVSGNLGVQGHTFAGIRPSSSNLAEGATDLRFHRMVRRSGGIGGEERRLEFIVAQELDAKVAKVAHANPV